MIENEEQLNAAYDRAARLNRLRASCETETLWSPAGRQEVVEGIVSEVRKVEREIADYLASKYESPGSGSDKPLEEDFNLSPEEKADLLDAIAQGEADYAAGRYTTLEAFKAR